MSTDTKRPRGALAVIEAAKSITAADLAALSGSDLAALHDHAYCAYHAAGRELDRRRQADVVTARPAAPVVTPEQHAEGCACFWCCLPPCHECGAASGELCEDICSTAGASL